jgi:hypothetical protein
MREDKPTRIDSFGSTNGMDAVIEKVASDFVAAEAKRNSKENIIM